MVHVLWVIVIVGLTAGSACSTRRPDAGRMPAASDIEEISLGPRDRMGRALRLSLLDSVSRARERWTRSGPQAYELRVVERSGCFEVQTRDDGTRPVYRIVAGSIQSSRSASVVDSLRDACWPPWTADSLFARILSVLQDSTALLGEVTFDPHIGLPRSFVQVRCFGCSHGRARIMVDYFSVSTP